MVCYECGFTCPCIFWHDDDCVKAHTPIHTEILSERAKYEQDVRNGMRSIFGKPLSKHCPSCENNITSEVNEYGENIHRCKKEKESIDYIDFFVKIFGKKKG